ncbi:UL16-binding protein 1-like isoform X4 [Myotis daubentonii]|uniref:UL16-binding protein 1-like isoform X4 n=1 Tax=Myotis daubentonii TaxID=98922 RepID=UPI0028738EFF|nr:UL16-binding protein 1-like isoform X4 [Myotis daubentonii]XP_059556045.1 UL16-binding protein 1-like isoform X4 [Myotis daubentonii]
MVGTVGTTLSPVFLLWILPQHSAWAAPLGEFGAISLSYKFTITPDGQPWCKIQGQINGNEFLDYNCNSQKNATEVWERQTKTLKGLMGELKKNLLDIKPEIIKIIGIDSFSLQGTMMCKQESNGHNNASWKFGFNGHKSLLFNVENKSWTVLRPEGQPLKETLASDRAMTGELVSIATQDCIDWLQQVSGTQGEVLSTKALLSFFISTGLLLEILQNHLKSAPERTSQSPSSITLCRSRSDWLHQPLPQPQFRPRPQPACPSFRSSL